MENANKYLLNDFQKTTWIFSLRESEKEFDKAEGMRSLIGKYYERLWFQKAMQKTEAELLIEHKRLARLEEWLEESVNEAKTALYLHRCAEEYLHKNPPTIHLNVDLHKQQLVQITLF